MIVNQSVTLKHWMLHEKTWSRSWC